MSTRNFALGLGLLLPLASATPADAQRVRADIIIGGGPVAGRVIIGNRGRDGYYGRPRPIRGVEWVRARDYRRDDWWRRFQRESRLVVVFWDRDDDRYYLDRFRSNLLEIRIYEQGGRYYRLEDDGYGRRYDDRYDNRSDGRYDGPYYDRSYGRYDARHDKWHRNNRRDQGREHRGGRRDDREDHDWDDDRR